MILRKMQRVILGLKKNNEFKVPKFSECVVDFFTKELNFAFVSCSLKDDMLILTQNENGFKLQHSPECPVKILSQREHADRMDDIQPEKKVLDISVAVSVIIESSDHHVLLTRRPFHMRSSPRVWVAPGGHLEFGETLFQGGVREVKEETGLNIEKSEANILCLWENVYPLILGFGVPSNHVLVVYFYVKMTENHMELQKRIKLDPEEVDSCCWLSARAISELFKFKQTNINNQKQYVLESGEMIEKDLDPNTMFNMYLWTKNESYSGVQYALKNWIEKCSVNDTCISKF